MKNSVGERSVLSVFDDIRDLETRTDLQADFIFRPPENILPIFGRDDGNGAANEPVGAVGSPVDLAGRLSVSPLDADLDSITHRALPAHTHGVAVPELDMPGPHDLDALQFGLHQQGMASEANFPLPSDASGLIAGLGEPHAAGIAIPESPFLIPNAADHLSQSHPIISVHTAGESSPLGGSDPSGQLWYGLEDLTNSGLVHIDSDGAGHAVSDVPTTSGNANVTIGSEALDGADGLYFFYGRDGLLRDGHIENDVETGSSSELSSVDMVFGTGFNADIVNALAVDPINHIIYVGHWGQTDALTGIFEVQYNPTTGALTSPFNATSDTVTDSSHVLIHDDNNGLVNGTTALTDITAMQYDMQNGNLYYVDESGTWAGSTTSGAAWAKQNGIYVVSTTTANPTPVLLTLTSQFAGETDNHAYIIGLAINEAQGLIYFAVNNAGAHTSTFWYMPIAGGTATQMSAPVGFGFVDADSFGGVNPLAFDANARQLYISDQTNHTIAQFTLSADGHSFASGTDSFQSTNPGADGGIATSLFYDPLPSLSALSATSTEAVQGGSALTLLTADPTITDPQDGASNKLHMGFMQVVIANAQAGDNLYYNGVQSGTFDSGTMSISWNSSTHTLTLTGNETEAFYSSLFNSITFQDSGTDNSTGSHPTRTADWIISDGITTANHTVSDPNFHQTTVIIDRAPTLVADSYSPVQESGSQSGTSGTGGTGVLGNDSDKDADAITVTAVNGSGANVGNSIAGTYGHLTLNANGSLSYNADNTSAIAAAANGSHPIDTFTYTVSDGLGGVTTSTVSFTINRAPTVISDSGASVESSSGSGNVLTNDSDKDGDSLTVSAVNGVAGNVGNSVAGTYGHITIGSNGSYTYSADNTAAIDGAATGSHLTDTITYTASDAHGGTTTSSIVVTLDRAPTLVADSGASVESSSGNGNVLTNDSDRDGDTLTVSAINGSAGNVGNSVAGTYGHINIGSNGSYTYNADNTAAIDGAATGSHLSDTFTYTTSDGHGGTTTTNLVVTLDRAPTVAADTGAAVESASGSGNVLTNDSDRDGDTLAISAVAGVAGNVGASVAGTYGHITIHADGSFTYNADNAGAIDGAATGAHLTDTFAYTASDGHGGTTTTNLVVTLDRAPTVVADTGASVESSSGTGNILANDSDRDGDALTVSAVAGLAGNVGASVAGTYGHITIGSNGSYTYSADNTAAIDGAVTGSHLTDTFSYTASDGHGGTTTTNLVVTLDRAPTVSTDSTDVAESATANVTAAAGVLSNDSDRDGDSLTVSAVAGSAGSVGNSIAGTYGHLTLNGDGSYSYVADITAAINGAAEGSHPVDTFAYTANDGHGGTTSSTLSFSIDRPAIADNDAFTTDQATAIGAGLNVFSDNGSGADHDPDGSGAFNVTGVTGGTVGTQFALPSGALLTVNADGTFAYDPNHAFDSLHLAAPGSGAADTFTTDSFSYTITGGATATATVTIDGADTANTIYEGSSGNDTVTGSPTLPDLFHLEQGGNDTATGGAADDGFYFGGAFNAADTVNGGGGTNNQIGLEGDYSGGLTLGPNTIANIQVIACLPGFSYDLTTVDNNVAAGQSLTIWAAHLGASNTLTFDGSAESNGSFTLFGGAGNDTLIGGAGADTFYGLGGADTLTGNGGDDRFVYTQVSESTGNATGTAYDTVTDFDATADSFDLPVAVTGVDPAVAVGALTSSAFDTTLASSVNATDLAAHHAVLFSPDAGDYVGHTFLIVDANGTAGYQAGADFVFDVTGASHLGSLGTGDFI